LCRWPARDEVGVEPPRVSPQKPFHPRHQIGLRRLDHQMKMIVHQAIRVNLPTGLDAGFGEGVKEPLAIGVVAENEFATVTAVQDVVNRTGILNAKFAGQAAKI
jgi:hypothetical protein